MQALLYHKAQEAQLNSIDMSKNTICHLAAKWNVLRILLLAARGDVIESSDSEESKERTRCAKNRQGRPEPEERIREQLVGRRRQARTCGRREKVSEQKSRAEIERLVKDHTSVGQR